MLRAYSTSGRFIARPCSGFAPDSLVQQNKNAYLFSFLQRTVAHLPQKLELFQLFFHHIVKSGCCQCNFLSSFAPPAEIRFTKLFIIGFDLVEQRKRLRVESEEQQNERTSYKGT